VKISVETAVKAGLDAVWKAWNDPEDIQRWNCASEDWHTPKSSVDLREGQNPPEMQREGWQAILDSFARHVERSAS
jgi:uncharacterized protein YndB with AHSA1/START domain